MSVDELAEEFGVTREPVQAVLQFAAHGTPPTLARYLIDHHTSSPYTARAFSNW